MGLRGPIPKPTAVNKLNGYPGHRAPNAREPKYRSGVPMQPPHMSRAAQLIWDELVGEMAPSGVLRAVDGQALAQLCEDQATLNELRHGVAKMTREIAKQAKAKKQNLAGGAMVAFSQTSAGRRTIATMRELSGQIIIQRREFGLTPASNSRVEGGMIGPSGHFVEQDPLEQALCVN